MSTYQSFYNYYGGTSPRALRIYAVQSLEEHEPERAAMFIKLAEEMEHGVVFHLSTEGGKLHYYRYGRGA